MSGDNRGVKIIYEDNYIQTQNKRLNPSSGNYDNFYQNDNESNSNEAKKTEIPKLSNTNDKNIKSLFKISKDSSSQGQKQKCSKNKNNLKESEKFISKKISKNSQNVFPLEKINIKMEKVDYTSIIKDASIYFVSFIKKNDSENYFYVYRNDKKFDEIITPSNIKEWLHKEMVDICVTFFERNISGKTSNMRGRINYLIQNKNDIFYHLFHKKLFEILEIFISDKPQILIEGKKTTLDGFEIENLDKVFKNPNSRNTIKNNIKTLLSKISSDNNLQFEDNSKEQGISLEEEEDDKLDINKTFNNNISLNSKRKKIGDSIDPLQFKNNSKTTGYTSNQKDDPTLTQKKKGEKGPHNGNRDDNKRIKMIRKFLKSFNIYFLALINSIGFGKIWEANIKNSEVKSVGMLKNFAKKKMKEIYKNSKQKNRKDEKAIQENKNRIDNLCNMENIGDNAKDENLKIIKFLFDTTFIDLLDLYIDTKKISSFSNIDENIQAKIKNNFPNINNDYIDEKEDILTRIIILRQFIDDKIPTRKKKK